MEHKHWTVTDRGVHKCPVCNMWYYHHELGAGKTCPNCGFHEKKRVTPKIKGAKYDDNIAEKDPKKKEAKLTEIVDNLQKTLED